MIHSCRTVSATSLRDRRPGADARGQVCTTASATNSASEVSSHDPAGPARGGSASGAPFMFDAGGRPLVQREVRAGAADAGESGEGEEEGVVRIVDPALVGRKRGELPRELVILL